MSDRKEYTSPELSKLKVPLTKNTSDASIMFLLSEMHKLILRVNELESKLKAWEDFDVDGLTLEDDE